MIAACFFSNSPEKVEPTAPEVSERIRAENELLRNMRQRNDSRTDFARGFYPDQEGQSVGKGEVVAQAGATGRVAGAHPGA